MGTRSIIAVPLGDGWGGRYVHWDGYPTGVGASLNVARIQLGSVDNAITKLIYNEPVGWSSIAGADFTKPSTWTEPGEQRTGGPESYSARGETSQLWLSSDDEHDSGCEWLYIICQHGVMVSAGDYGEFGMGGGNFRHPVLVEWSDQESFYEAMREVEQMDHAATEDAGDRA